MKKENPKHNTKSGIIRLQILQETDGKRLENINLTENIKMFPQIF